ncbi:MAG: hypothetical protein IKF91_02215 [Bacilli bacterium]|nr:hypothetical protein [Bacilli bacterium]
MRRKCFWVLLLALLFFTGCVDKQQAQQYREQGKINALNYIKKKYGFEAEVVDISNFINSGNPVPVTFLSDDVYLQLKYKNKQFTVVITGSEPSDSGFDDYQNDIIIKDISILIKRKIKGIYKYDINYGNRGDNLMDDYYDGTNISDFMSKSISELTIDLYFVGSYDFKSFDFENFSDEFTSPLFNVNFYSFSSKKNYVDYVNGSDFKLPYIDTMLSYERIYDGMGGKKTGIYFYNYKDKLYKYGDMYLYGVIDYGLGHDYYSYDNVVNEKLIKLDIHKFNTDWFNHKTLFDTLLINSHDNAYKLHVFVPKNKYKRYNKDREMLLMTKEDNCISFHSVGESDSYYKSDVSILKKDKNIYLSLTRNVSDWYKDECH